jgi:hypothetical protein
MLEKPSPANESRAGQPVNSDSTLTDDPALSRHVTGFGMGDYLGGESYHIEGIDHREGAGPVVTQLLDDTEPGGSKLASRAFTKELSI